MKAGAIVLAVLMLLTGGVWIGQGLGYIKGSFMTGDMHWFWIGAGLWEPRCYWARLPSSTGRVVLS